MSRIQIVRRGHLEELTEAHRDLSRPRTDIVAEHVKGPGRFSAVSGPFSFYERHLEMHPVGGLSQNKSGDASTVWQLVETITYRLAIPVWAWLFYWPVRQALRRRRDSHSYWWAPPDRLDARHTTVLGLLCTAQVVDGYLGTVLTQTLTFAADEFGHGNTAQGIVLGVVRTGVLLALVMATLADRHGRRRLLVVAGIVSCATTAVGAVSPALWFLGASQLVARGLSTALGILIVIMAAEEMPARCRAWAVSLLVLCAGLGAGMAVWVLPLADLHVRAWRVVYLIPVLGIAVIVWVGRRLPESQRFETALKASNEGEINNKDETTNRNTSNNKSETIYQNTPNNKDETIYQNTPNNKSETINQNTPGSKSETASQNTPGSEGETTGITLDTANLPDRSNRNIEQSHQRFNATNHTDATNHPIANDCRATPDHSDATNPPDATNHPAVPLRTRRRQRLALLATAAFLLAMFAAPASGLQNDFLKDERGFSAAGITMFTLATSTPTGIGVLAGGYLAERRGRRQVGATGLALGASAAALAFFTSGPTLWLLTLAGTLLGGMAVPALAVYGPELFGTVARGRANGLITNIGVAGSALGLLVVGWLSDALGGQLAPALALTAVGPLAVAILVVTKFPESAGLELEELNPEDQPSPPQRYMGE